MKKNFLILISALLHYVLSQNCLKCKPGFCTQNGCTQCEDGFYRNSMGLCGLYSPIQGCYQYDVLFTNRCSKCNDDRYLNDNRCILKPRNCFQIDQNRQCISCNPGFEIIRGRCYVKDITKCPIGSFPSSIQLQFCQPLQAQNCRRLQGDDLICTMCQPGYGGPNNMPINGRCLRFSSTSTPCPNNNCKCPIKFFKWEGRCVQLQIDKCLQLRDDGLYCVACQRGFVAIQGICLQPVKQNDVNCNVKAANSDYCTGCNKDYFLNEDALCVREFPYTVCPTSSGLFRNLNGKCLYKDQRCESVNATTLTCRRCIEGFQINPTTGLCERIACLSYQLDQNNRIVCRQVFVGYTLINGQIVRLPPSCLTLVPGSKTVCAQCSAFTRNLTLTSNPGSPNVCAYYDQFCVQYNTFGSCVACYNANLQNGYILKQRFCYKKAQNCLLRDSTDLSKCISCSNNFHLDQRQRICYPNTIGCQVYLTGSECKQCLPNYSLYNKKCLFFNNQCTDTDGQGRCRKCTQGLIPFRQSCVYFHPYCLQYGADRVCSKAAAGWSLGTGMTQEQKNYYQQFILRGEAVKSRNNMVSLNGLSINIGAGTYNAGAIINIMPYANLIHNKINSVNMYGQIVNCNLGYTKINNNCMRSSVSNCVQYSFDQICIKCLPQYTLNGDFTCIPGLFCQPGDPNTDGRCINCAQGFVKMGDQCFKVQSRQIVNALLLRSNYYNQSIGTSYIAWPKIFNCRIQRDAFTCSQCLPPYTNFNGVCIIQTQRCVDYTSSSTLPGSCQLCSSDSVLLFGQCRRLNCPQVTNGVCSSCPPSFYYYFGTCLGTEVASCRIFENGGCLLCSPGFYANLQNRCIAQVPRCLTMNRDTGRCLQCRRGFTLYREICVLQIKYCEDYDTDNRCINCQNNPVNRTQKLSNGTCALLQGQCQRVSQATGQCQACNTGFTMIIQQNRNLCVNLRDNCITYDVRGRCTTCNTSYILQFNRCNIFLQFCLNYSNDNTRCILCTPQTVLDNGCCKIPDSKCINYNRCFCISCLSGYYLSAVGRCQINPQNCEIYDRQTLRCTKCANNSFMMPNGTCSPGNSVINGCEQRDSKFISINGSFRCLRCMQGFQLNMTDYLCYGYRCLVVSPATRQCVSCPLYYKIYRRNPLVSTEDYCIPYFCQTYIPLSNQCLVNMTTYNGGATIITTTLQIMLMYCLRFDPASGKCLQCSNFRYPNKNELFQICYPLFCKSTFEFNCNSCQFGYGPHPEYPGSCVPSFCSKIRPDGKCQVCTPPYTLNNMGLCQNRGCCQQYDNVLNTCRLPKKYFTLQNGICAPMNCLITDATRLLICIKCVQGYTLHSDGTCKVSNCQVDSLNGQSCITCLRGFRTQTSNITLKNICLPSFCQQYSTDFSYCIKCIQGFTLDSDRFCRSNFCKEFLPSLFCKTCIDFYRKQNERCVPDCRIGDGVRCYCCNFGFALNLTSSLCQPSDSFCIRKNSLGGICQQCMQGYVIVTGQCIQSGAFCRAPSLLGCNQCNPGFQSIQNCRCQTKYCLGFNQNGTCNQCHPRFELVNGLCKHRDCRNFTQGNWTCNSCLQRFTFNIDRICTSRFCQQWQDTERTYCKKCGVVNYLSRRDNYAQTYRMSLRLINGGCYIRYCIRNAGQQQCAQCAPGYILTMSRICQCENLDPVTGECKCLQGYIYDPVTQQCQVNMDPCLQRDTNQKCVQCPALFQNPSLTNNQCVVLYCKTYIAVAARYYTCQTCYPNFALNQQKFCRNIFCRSYENRPGIIIPQCSICADGYVPYNDYCIPSNCNAATYNLIEGKCTQCVQGYQLSPDKTKCVLMNCDVFDPNDKCIKCKKGFAFNNGTLCIAQNCRRFNNSICIECNSGLSLLDGTCVDKNCNQTNEQNICIRCKDGYLLNENSLCKMENCIQQIQQKCSQCIRGYVFNFNAKKCVVINCFRFTPTYDCQKCVAGFFRQNGTCIDVYCNITKFIDNYRCIQCMNGYSFNDKGLCYPNGVICPPGRFFDKVSGSCQQIPVSDCLVFIENKCMYCADGFFLFNAQCYSIQYCRRYSYYYGCYQCLPSSVLQGRSCRPIDSDPNCEQFAFNKCVKCSLGYLNFNGKCTAAPLNCLQLGVNGLCSRCAPGYGYNAIQNTCQFSDINCIQVNNLGRCVRCRDNLTLNQLGLCTNMPANCLTLDANNRCQTCAFRYYQQNGRCFKQIQFCRRYSQKNEQCSQCLQNFLLISNRCVCSTGFQFIQNRICRKLPQNCAQIDQTSYSCVRCVDNYQLLPNFTCVSNITPQPPQFCAVYDLATTICKQCISNYILVNNACRFCGSGRIKIGNQCFDVIIGCNIYQSNGLCRICHSNFRLDNGRCLSIQVIRFCQLVESGICRRCQAGYNITNNGQQCILNNCLVPSADGLSCVRCFDLFTWTGRQCLQQPSFCNKYNQTTKLCQQCAPGYALSADFKLCILVNCQLMDPTGLACSRCVAPFQWNGQFCVFTTDFCLNYVNGYCSSCLSFATLKGNRCIPNFCQVYNDTLGVCQTCVNGYTLNQRRCFLIIMYCIAYADTGSCIQCQSGYSIANGGASCQATTISSCFSGSGNVCYRCRHRYYVDSQMCSAYIPYCINIDILGNCISCCFGSSLVNGTCVKDSAIKYCSNQVGNKCTQCLPNYSYCSFCDACLPISPNCQQYNSMGDCIRCIPNFILLNQVCISLPVGEIIGAQGTCRSGYYLKNSNCYRNKNDLRLYSQSRQSNVGLRGAAGAMGAPSPTSSQAIVIKSSQIMIIFSVIVTTRGQVGANTSFLLYYRSKNFDPLVCWNSCLPTRIDSQNYEKELVYPIIATQVQVYFINGNRQSSTLDFRIL